MNKHFFLLAIFSFGVLCISPISINSVKACDKNSFALVIKTSATVNNIDDTAEDDFYSSSTMIYPLNHF